MFQSFSRDARKKFKKFKIKTWFYWFNGMSFYEKVTRNRLLHQIVSVPSIDKRDLFIT